MQLHRYKLFFLISIALKISSKIEKNDVRAEVFVKKVRRFKTEGLLILAYCKSVEIQSLIEKKFTGSGISLTIFLSKSLWFLSAIVASD
jgi:hypothetical protein